MSSVQDSRDLIHVGLDVHARSISVAVLPPGRDESRVTVMAPDRESVDRLVAGFVDPGGVFACYEAGPTGYDLARQLIGLGVACDVIAPSLIPRAPGERIKTDKRDCQRLARLHRAGELTAIRIPTVAEEGVRDLCRARADMVIDETRAKHRLAKFLLRHGRVWSGGHTWTEKHRRWLTAQHFDDPAVEATLTHYLATLSAREAAVDAIEAELARWYDREPFAEAVARLGAYKGITHQGALLLASEVCDWRRFPTAGSFMAFCGLVPSEHSSGGSTRRGHITHTGNVHVRTQLVESAWSYRSRPYLGATLRARQQGVAPDVIARSWKAQLRLCRRFAHLDARKTNRNVVVTAIARELAGFVWAEMTT